MGTLIIINSDSNTVSKLSSHVENNLKFEVNLKANERTYLLLYNKDTTISSLGAYKVYVETP